MRHVRSSRRIKARPVFDDLSIYALRPAADGIVTGAAYPKEIPFGFLPGSNFFVVHALTLGLRTAARQRPGQRGGSGFGTRNLPERLDVRRSTALRSSAAERADDMKVKKRTKQR